MSWTFREKRAKINIYLFIFSSWYRERYIGIEMYGYIKILLWFHEYWIRIVYFYRDSDKFNEMLYEYNEIYIYIRSHFFVCSSAKICFISCFLCFYTQITIRPQYCVRSVVSRGKSQLVDRRNNNIVPNSSKAVVVVVGST